MTVDDFFRDNDMTPETTSDIILHQNDPNPFYTTTRIRFGTPAFARIELKIFNHIGQEACTLIHADYQPGEHEVTWDGKNNAGERVPPGTYYCRLRTGEITKRIKISFAG